MNMVTTDNPTMPYDSTVLYDNAGHANAGTTALSISGLIAVQTAMRSQTAYNESLEILGERNRAKFLIVPNELEYLAKRIINPSDAFLGQPADPGSSTVYDPQTFKGSGIIPIVYDALTDATDWYVMADPTEVPTMVMGFLNGQQEPEMFVQDQPTVGSNFTSDKVSYKIRHIYGGQILEHRSFYKQVVGG
jgi:hypothetical protein